MTSVQPDVKRASLLRSRLLRFIASLAAAGTVVASGLTLSSFAARWWWRFEQACHFRVQYFWLLALAAIVLLAVRRRQLALLAAVAAIVNAIAILPIYWPASSVSAAGAQIRVVSFNVLSQNSEQAEVLAFLRAQQADLVLLIEISNEWADAIEGLSDLYPHRHVVPRDDNFGIALLSRIPWSDVQIVDLSRADVPTIVGRFEIDQCPVVVVGAHPLPPGSRLMAELRNDQLVELANFVRSERGDVIVVGDLNTTDFSPYFGDLLSATGLRESRQGRGVQASWGPLPFMEIAIDHCLVSPDIVVLNRSVGPHLGSDHRPVIADVRLLAAVEGGNRQHASAKNR